MENQQIEAVKEIDYLGVTLESSRGWRKQKAKQKLKGLQSLVTIHKCLTRTPDMGVKLLGNVYEMVYESRMMYGVEIWGIEEGWKQIDKIHGRMCKKILGIPRFAANGVTELELGRDSRRGKVMNSLVTYWPRISQMDKDDLVKVFYDWQINNAQYDGWEKKLEKELNKIGLGHILRNPTENQRGTVCKEVKVGCNDVERQNFVANLSEKRSLILY
jgi:hypothetical protein